MTRSAAFFDLDRTLMAGASPYYLGKICHRAGLLPWHRLVADGARALAFKLFGASDEKSEALRDRILSSVAGHEAHRFAELVPAVIHELLPRIRPEARDLLAMHEQAGRDVYLVSASPAEIVADLARALGVAGGLGTEPEVVDGVYTGQLAGSFCYGEGKAEVARALSAERDYDLTRCYAYADSASDLPLLQIVGHPVAVNPDRSLLSVAHRRGWPIVEFNRQAKQAAKLASAGTTAAGAALGGYALGRYHARRGALARRTARWALSLGR